MKKKIGLSGIVCAILVAVTCMFAFTACGATKYTYSGCTATVNGSTASSTQYDKMYKDSYIVVSDDKIKWTVGDTTEELKITKDGDKDKLGGDYAEELSEMYKESGMNASVEIYGQSVDGGYDIVISVKISAMGISSESKVTLNFKA